MQFVIIDTEGKPLADVAGQLILLGSRDEATRWLARGERVEPYVPKRHAINGSGRQPNEPASASAAQKLFGR